MAAQHRSLRKAAESLKTRQSTLSRRLRDLELRLGVILFERTNGGTRPTLIGHEFLEAARRIVEDADVAFLRLKARCRGENGRLAIGIYTSLSTGNLRATLMEHRRRFPEVEVHTIDGQRNYLLSDLAAGAVDIVVMTNYHSNWDGRTLPLWSERVIIALPEQHPLSLPPVVHWQEVRNEPILLPERDPGPELQQMLATKLGGFDQLRVLHQDVGLDRLLSLVGAGYGGLLVLEGATGAHYDGVVYRELHDDDGASRLNFTAYWRESNDNPTLGPFLDLLRERYPDISTVPSPD